jgi:hypothetical protein
MFVPTVRSDLADFLTFRLPRKLGGAGGGEVGLRPFNVW